MITHDDWSMIDAWNLNSYHHDLSLLYFKETMAALFTMAVWYLADDM